jgi:hypothetical protein
MQKLTIKKKEEDVLEIDPERLVEIQLGTMGFHLDSDRISTRSGGKFYERALFLPDGYDYVIGVDELGSQILVPLKKI